MPKELIKSLAKKSGVSKTEVEAMWQKLKAEYGDNYKAIIGTMEKVLAGDSNRETTPFNHLKVEECVITEEGVNKYLGRELDATKQYGLDPDKEYRVYRPLSEIKKALDSYNNVPLVNEHFFVDKTATNKDKWLGGTGTNAHIKDGQLLNSIAVWDKNGVELIEKVKQGLSAGYSYNLVMDSGVWNGQPYDLKQSNICCNHVALCKTPRVVTAKVADSIDNILQGDNMENKLLAALMAKMPQLIKDTAEELEKGKDKTKDNSAIEKVEALKAKSETEDSDDEDDDKDMSKDKKKGRDKKRGKDKDETEEKKPEDKKEELTGDSIAALVQAGIVEHNVTRALCERAIGKVTFAADSTPEQMINETLKAKGIQTKSLGLDAKKAVLQYIADSKVEVKPLIPQVATDSNGSDGYNSFFKG